MRLLRLIPALLPVLALVCMVALAGCTPGNLGTEEIAFVRDGDLWTVDSNGANAFTVVAQSTPVVGYGFSPNHEIFTFRTLNDAFVRTTPGRHLALDPLTGLTGDAPGTLNTVGIDGGSPIPLIDAGSSLSESNAWWSPNGSRLLYREGNNPAAWWISQNDQPLGIARKALPVSYSIPSINAQSSMAIGNSDRGIFTTTLAGTDLRIVQSGILTGHPLPASLERVLWQPAHAQPALLYAVAAPSSNKEPDQFTLVMRAANGQTHTLAQCACRQFAWSPDGSMVLYSTPQGYTVQDVQDGSSFHFTAEQPAVPYWSPDSKDLLLDGLHTLALVQIAGRQMQTLLSDGQAAQTNSATLPEDLAALQPIENSLWNADGQRFVLITRGRLQWQGHSLETGNGLYTVTLGSHDRPQGDARLVDGNAHDIQPGWSYADPNTSFLF